MPMKYDYENTLIIPYILSSFLYFWQFTRKCFVFDSLHFEHTDCFPSRRLQLGYYSVYCHLLFPLTDVYVLVIVVVYHIKFHLV